MPLEAKEIPPLAAIDAALCRRSLYRFLVAAWSVIDPTALEDNWHLKVVCDAVQKCLTGKGNVNLLVNIPPGTAKSTIVSVMAPAWMWLQSPGWSGLFASGNAQARVRDSLKCRALVRSAWYQSTFKPQWQLADDQDQKTLFKNTSGGYRQTIGVEAGVTGSRATAVFVDDPMDAADAQSKLVKDGVAYWYTNSYSNRLNDLRTGQRVVIMQRLAVDDLSGHILQMVGPDAYDHLCLPTEYDPTRPDPRDPRKVAGEAISPRFSEGVLRTERAKGGLYFAGQHQQLPFSADGEMFKPVWFRFYGTGTPGRPHGCNDFPAVALPEEFDEIITSWDCAFKETKESDFVAGGVWGRKGANKFLLARFHKRTGLKGTMEAIRHFSTLTFGKKGKRPRKHLVEDKANGSAVIETLKDEIPGMVAVNPEGGKESRAAAISPQIEAGNVFLPEGATWLTEFLGECAAFPVGPHDDEVDQMTQALLVLETSRTNIGARFVEAAKNGFLDRRRFGFVVGR